MYMLIMSLVLLRIFIRLHSYFSFLDQEGLYRSELSMLILLVLTSAPLEF
jgi:hypothetical protein